MNNNFKNSKLEKETVEEMIVELVYLRKVIDNAVYYGTCISLMATHLIDNILYFHNNGIKDEFTVKELEEMVDQIDSGKSSQKFLDLNINHINDSMKNLDLILNKILEMNSGQIIESFYDDITGDTVKIGDFNAK